MDTKSSIVCSGNGNVGNILEPNEILAKFEIARTKTKNNNCYCVLCDFECQEISALEWRSAVWCCWWSCCCVADYKSSYADLNVNSRIWIDFEWNASADKCSPPRKHQPYSQLSNVWFAWKTSLKCWWCQWDKNRRIFWFLFLFVSGFATLHCHRWRACCCSRHCTVVVWSFHCLQALNFPHTQLQMPLNGKWCNFHFIVVFVFIPLLLFASCNWSVLPAATPQHNKYDQRRHCERDLPIELSWADQADRHLCNLFPFLNGRNLLVASV